MFCLSTLLLLGLVSAKQDCVPGSWSEWSSCSENCGATGTRERDRKIEVLPTTDGIQCSTFTFKETEACNRICYNGGSVTDTKCDCRTGFTGSCCELDVDECANANGGCQQKCVNELGSFKCRCWDGFQLNEFGKCEDINECTSGMQAGCQKVCMNYPGGYSCGCTPPSILEMDGKSCADENYCLTTPEAFNCSHHCVIHKNSFQCDCPEGYELDSSEFKCIDQDECANNHFCIGGTCINSNGTAFCECGVGRGLDPEGVRCIDVDECQPGLNQCSHTCENVNAGHVCLCPAGMVVGRDHKTCEDENECLREPSPCSHTCTNLNPYYSCLCPEGMELESDERTCCEVGKCIAPLNDPGNSVSWIIGLSTLAIFVVLILVIIVWRTLKRTIRSNEQVVRAIQHGADVYYNRNTDMELETRGMGLAVTSTRAEPYHTFQRRNVLPPTFSIDDEGDKKI